MKPSVSIVIPTRNRVELLRRAVASAVRQSLGPNEVLIVDDGSTEECMCEIERWAVGMPQVSLWRQSHQGAAAARNLGANRATGDALLFLDSDDQLSHDAIAQFSEALMDRSVAVACAPAEFVNAAGQVVGTSKPRELGAAYENERGLFLAGTFAVRRDVFQEVGGFASQCRSSQHTEFALRLVPYLKRAGMRVDILEQPSVRVLTDRRAHLRGNLHNLLDGALYIIQAHEQQLRKSPRYYADWCAIAGVYAAKLRRYSEARQLFWRAVRLCPARHANLARLVLAHVPVARNWAWNPRNIA